MKTSLITGDLIATGVQFHHFEREVIAPEAWHKLWPKFAHECAMGTAARFEQVLLRANVDPKAIASAMRRKLVPWLREQATTGATLKNGLLQRAQQQFGNALSHRVFNVAYREVFMRTRGRPPKKK